MVAILTFALGAAVYPQLLAIVVVILTRPQPRRLLWACYLGAICVSAGAGAAVLAVFRDHSDVAGSTSHRVGGSVYLVVGAIAVLVAFLVATERGRALLGANLGWMRRRRGERNRGPGSVGRLKARAETALQQGSVVIAVAVGAALGIPGPFDVLALGHMSSGGYAVIALIGLIIAFTLIKFLVIEVPILSYTVDPDGTGARVDRFSAWLREHQIKVIAVVIGVIGLVLIERGIARLG